MVIYDGTKQKFHSQQMEVTKTMVFKVKTLKKSWMSFKILGEGSQKHFPKWWLNMVIQSHGIIRKTSPKKQIQLTKRTGLEGLRHPQKKSKSVATKSGMGTGDFFNMTHLRWPCA